MDFTGLDPVLVFLVFPFSFLVIQFAPFVKRACGVEMSYVGVVLSLPEACRDSVFLLLHVSAFFYHGSYSSLNFDCNKQTLRAPLSLFPISHLSFSTVTLIPDT